MSYKPYRKLNNDPIYINKNSNHPPSILKQLPISIEKRLSEISSSEDMFNESKPLYENALKTSGYNVNFEYINETHLNEDEKIVVNNHKRKIIWFNLPYSMNVKTNIGKVFFKLLKKHFPKTNKLHKIFNRNNVKISYSCTRNMGSIISSHNKSILNKSNEPSFSCNCRVKADCPVENKCLTPNVIYQAEVTNNMNDEKMFYIGLTSNTFKERCTNHKTSFKHKKCEKETELSKYIWKLKDLNQVPSNGLILRKSVVERQVVSANYV